MRALVLTAISLLSFAVAQEQPSATQQSSEGAQSIQGCLLHSGDSFVLDASGTQYRVLGGDASQLKSLTGHTVSVTGQKSGNEITLKSAQDVSSTCESNTSTTNSTGSTSADDKTRNPDKNPKADEPKEKPPMSEQPPMGPPPHAQLAPPPVTTAASAAAEAANAEAASASKPVYSEARHEDQVPPK